MTLEDAIHFATRAHRGQKDKAGAPYILHPLRVMLACQTDEERLAALFHDVAEDCGVTLNDLRAQGLDEKIVVAVDCLTKRAGEEYFDAIARVAKNPIARAVKIADLTDNSNLARIALPTDEDHARIAKYQRALRYSTPKTVFLSRLL